VWPIPSTVDPSNFRGLVGFLPSEFDSGVRLVKALRIIRSGYLSDFELNQPKFFLVYISGLPLKWPTMEKSLMTSLLIGSRSVAHSRRQPSSLSAAVRHCPPTLSAAIRRQPPPMFAAAAVLPPPSPLFDPSPSGSSF